MKEWTKWLPLLATLALTEAAFTRPQRWKIGNLQKWLCQEDKCTRRFQDGWLVDIHHKVPLNRGGRDIISNGEVRCLEHHATVHEKMGDTETGRLIRFRLAQTGGRTIKWKEKNKRR